MDLWKKGDLAFAAFGLLAFFTMKDGDQGVEEDEHDSEGLDAACNEYAETEG